jgi:hypothetical protein
MGTTLASEKSNPSGADRKCGSVDIIVSLPAISFAHNANGNEHIRNHR